VLHIIIPNVPQFPTSAIARRRYLDEANEEVEDGLQPLKSCPSCSLPISALVLVVVGSASTCEIPPTDGVLHLHGRFAVEAKSGGKNSRQGALRRYIPLLHLTVNELFNTTATQQGIDSLQLTGCRNSEDSYTHAIPLCRVDPSSFHCISACAQRWCNWLQRCTLNPGSVHRCSVAYICIAVIHAPIPNYGRRAHFERSTVHLLLGSMLRLHCAQYSTASAELGYTTRCDLCNVTAAPKDSMSYIARWGVILWHMVSTRGMVNSAWIRCCASCTCSFAFECRL
jgi:hypothetical protein